ncbi:MAG TPA: hypothetical protein VGT40_20355 [Methylomirabilota bacterium]|jgi:hypothetical protein|nr:hypothetical protein [Methylomirabilota bacterium]
MPSEKSQPQPPVFSLPLKDIGAKTLDAVSAVTEANQRVVSQLIELGSTAAAEPLRTLGELQSAAMDAARSALAPVGPRDGFEEFRQDPVAWYGKTVLFALDSTERMLKLFETNTQIVTKSVERFQGSVERSGKEIQDATRACVSRLRDVYSRN